MVKTKMKHTPGPWTLGGCSGRMIKAQDTSSTVNRPSGKTWRLWDESGLLRLVHELPARRVLWVTQTDLTPEAGLQWYQP